MTHRYGALVITRLALAFLDNLNAASTFYLYIFLCLAVCRRRDVVAALYIERDGVILNFLTAALANQVVVERLQLGLIIRIITDLVKLNSAARCLLYLNFGLLSINRITHLLHTCRSLIQLVL